MVDPFESRGSRFVANSGPGGSTSGRGSPTGGSTEADDQLVELMAGEDVRVRSTYAGGASCSICLNCLRIDEDGDPVELHLVTVNDAAHKHAKVRARLAEANRPTTSDSRHHPRHTPLSATDRAQSSVAPPEHGMRSAWSCSARFAAEPHCFPGLVRLSSSLRSFTRSATWLGRMAARPADFSSLSASCV